MDGFHQSAEFFRLEQRRRATTEIDGVNGFRDRRCYQGDLAAHGFHHICAPLQRRRKVEVAVVAGLSAEWYMDVDAGHVEVYALWM